MCGIFGYIGEKDPLTICLEGLKKLEYRGYDSAGIAGVGNKSLFFLKRSGKIKNLEESLSKSKKMRLDLAIGHTRWATHGIPSENNAHPHFDMNKNIAVVHNGIIENFSLLKKELIAKDVKFSTDTDTEVIAQLIYQNYKNINKGNLYEAVVATLNQLQGSLAIAVIHQDHKDEMIVASRESPIAIGIDKKTNEKFISSDPNAFIGRDLDILFLKNNQIAIASKTDLKVFDCNNNAISFETSKLQGQISSPDKGNFKHYMLKEIFEQPLTVQKAMLGNISKDYGTADFSYLTFSPQELMATKHILIIACGTSWHAGNIAQEMLEDKARIPTKSEIASEIRFKNPIVSDETLVIAISQSGETADTILAVREAKAKGAKILAICNVKNSTLVREADSCIFLNAGPEISVCSTKAFTSQVTVLSLFTLMMARLRHLSKEEGILFLNEIEKIPQLIQSILDRSKEIEELAKKYSQYDGFFFLGKRYMYQACLEAALKLKEISYLNASAYPAGELKHGPLALVCSKMPVVAFLANKQTYDKALSNLMEVKARGAPILALAPYGSSEIENIADDIIYMPKTIDELSIFTTSVVGQLFAYFIAVEKKTDIDQPRNLAKSVTVE